MIQHKFDMSGETSSGGYIRNKNVYGCWNTQLSYRCQVMKLLIASSTVALCLAVVSLVAGHSWAGSSSVNEIHKLTDKETLSFWTPNTSFTDITIDGSRVPATVFSLLSHLPLPDEDDQTKSYDRSAGLLLRIPSKSLLIHIDVPGKAVVEIPYQVLQARSEDLWELTRPLQRHPEQAGTELSIHWTTREAPREGQDGTIISFTCNNRQISMLKVKVASSISPGNQTISPDFEK